MMNPLEFLSRLETTTDKIHYTILVIYYAIISYMTSYAYTAIIIISNVSLTSLRTNMVHNIGTLIYQYHEPLYYSWVVSRHDTRPL